MNWNDILFTTIGIILTAVITWLGNKLSAFLTAHIKDAKALKYIRFTLGGNPAEAILTVNEEIV